MGHRKSSWEWLKDTIAARLGPDEAAAIWAEYNRRADLEEAEVLRRRYQRKLAEAIEKFKAGDRFQARTIERYQTYLDRLTLGPNSAPVRSLEVGRDG